MFYTVKNCITYLPDSFDERLTAHSATVWVGCFRFGLVRPSRDTPIPCGHESFFNLGIGWKRRIDDGKARTPFQVCDKRGPKLRVGRKIQLISRFEEEPHPVLTLLLRDAFSEVMANHRGMPTVLRRILSRTTQNFSDEFGDVLEVGRIHMAEQGFEDWVGRHLLVKALYKRRKSF
ncbi:hypothetical protein AciX8_0252 [Granulicella mallensis MP5ACTX8]|uniref:Uncharacterized protein n=1 Tax=Granulicella mallensis (strain ATCC BAA-1857 / DSM 23137 / MP5ACTX8) TaxID=682795 RepID=G8P0K2_GRAMM|nr:hypothetical protein AciX8_0252 [Granulicella mallensis MP5ACTX8]